MASDVVAIAVLGLFVAGIIKGATGLGYASCALPFLVLALGLRPAMAVVLAPAIATNIGLIIASGHFSETISSLKWLYVAMLPGIAFGVGLLLWVDQTVAINVLGIVISTYSIFGLFKPDFTLPIHLRKPIEIPVGFANGILTGLTGSQVVPVVPYILALNLDANRTAQAINIAVLVATFSLSVGLALTGVLTFQLAIGSILAIVPALAGMTIGIQLRARITPAWFKVMVLWVLLCIGIQMLFR